MTYKNFIEAMKLALETGQMIGGAAETDEEINHETLEFRHWRDEVTAQLGKIKREGYDPGCKIKQRNFNAITDDEDDREVFLKSLSDTLIEIERIIRHYNQDGEPKKTIKIDEDAIEEKCTNAEIEEFLKQLSITGWIKVLTWPRLWKIIVTILALASGAFYLGLEGQNWPIYKKYFSTAEKAKTEGTTANSICGLDNGLARFTMHKDVFVSRDKNLTIKITDRNKIVVDSIDEPRWDFKINGEKFRDIQAGYLFTPGFIKNRCGYDIQITGYAKRKKDGIISSKEYSPEISITASEL